MILLRRRHPRQFTISTIEVDVSQDMGRMLGARQYDHFAPWRPPIEVFETDAELVVRAELGGLEPTQVEVLISGKELLIRGDRSVTRHVGCRRYHESRVRYGPFEALVSLPFPVAGDSATAEYLDGFLTVSLPRLTATRVTTRENGRAIQNIPREEMS